MSLKSHCAIAILSVLATAALAATAADARPGQGRGHQPQASSPLPESVPLMDNAPPVQAPEITLEAPDVNLEPIDVVIGSPEAEQLPAGAPIGDNPVADGPSDRHNLPPGLQRQVDSGSGLPPGLQRQVEHGRGLPPGLQHSR